METLSHKEKLIQVEHEIGRLEPSACAELAFSKANSAIPNPWSGSIEKLHALKLQRDDLRLVERGQQLANLLEKKKELERRIERSHIARQAADRALAERSQDPTVIRYRAATMRCIALGWGHSWSVWTAWWESGRSLRDGAPENANFFMYDEAAKNAGVSFSIQRDRETIKLWLQAKEAADRALMAWNNDNEELRNLLRSHPELVDAT